VKNKRHVLGLGALTLFFAAGLIAAQVAVGKPPAQGDTSGGGHGKGGTTTSTTSTTPTTTTTSTTTPPPTTTVPTGSINLVDQMWSCRGPVNLDSVSVTMLTQTGNAVYLGNGCTGYIGRIDVVTYTSDGIKVDRLAHDLTVGGGSVRCYGRVGTVHQDGVQFLGSKNILFRNLDDRCYTSNDSDFFVTVNANYPSDYPANIICDGCYFGASTTASNGAASNGPSSTVFVIKYAVSSGIRNSTVCPGHYFTLRLLSPTSVNDNTTLPNACTGP
jgi:hypothetical protein